MSTSVEEQIAAELVARLEAVDFELEDVTVYRVNRDATEWQPKDKSIVVVQGEATRMPEMDCPGNPPAIAYDIEFAIVCFARQSDREKTPEMTKVNNFVATAKKGVTNSTDWHRFGSICFDAEFGNTIPFTPIDGALSGASVQLNCRYRVSELDPFVVR